MEPIKINVSVEVALSQPTLDVLGKLLGPRMTVTEQMPGFDPLPKQEPDPEPEEKPQPEKKRRAAKSAPAPVPEPVSAPAPEPDPAPVKEEDDDLPPDDAPDPVKAPTEAQTPTEADMREAIEKARNRKVPGATIRKHLTEVFGINTTLECPLDRRQELIDSLAKLSA